MKIAVCLPGHVRDYKKFSNLLFKRIINTNPEHEFDFFLHTWDVVDFRSNEKVDEKELIDIYNPKSLVIEEEIDTMFDEYMYLTRGNNAKSVFSQLYKIKKVSEILKEYVEKHNIKYDLVLKYRFDLDVISLRERDELNYEEIHVCDDNFDIIYDPIDFSKFDPNYFYSEFDGIRYYDEKTQSYTDYPNWLHDKSFVSSYENILTYSDIYTHLVEIIHRTGTSTTEYLIYDWVVNINKMKVKKTYKLFCNCLGKGPQFIVKNQSKFTSQNI